jgi:hypothetical protein
MMKPKPSKRSNVRPEIEYLYKPEPASKNWSEYERHLLNTSRKLPGLKRLELMSHAQGMVLETIEARRARRRKLTNLRKPKD